MGLIGDFLRAPRRLRELGEKYDRLFEVVQFLKVNRRHIEGLLKAEKQLSRRRAYVWQDRLSRTVALEVEVERLRTLNGETYQKYVRAKEAHDMLLQGRRPRF